ncbi:G-PROTEIN-RECEP-F1-2 domain-containing protein [Aphelenchoides bicaudatus]|nr:G-PROTEIN-RECEP-F1-2 domain-containing protein [Aphelenchoides bicaudatus]
MSGQFELADYQSYTQNDYVVPFQGQRAWVAYTYICFNVVGFCVNLYVLYVVAPLLFASKNSKIQKSILFYIFILCASDLLTLSGMFLLIIELVFGTWRFSFFSCVFYMVFDSMNKFVAPIIVVLISRTCYATYAIPQVLAALLVVIILLWPVFVYTEISHLPVKINHTTQEVQLVKKCGFMPSPKVQIGFNIITCIMSYVIPLFGFIYWYLSVPHFLRKRAETTLIRGSTSSSNGVTNIAMKKVTATVLVLTVIYVSCWTPYWLMLFLNQFFAEVMISRTLIIMMYFVHLLPYISCCAYPLIFTLMNRAIQRAHSQMLETQRRRIKSLTVDLSRQLRSAFGFRLLDRDNGLFPRSSISVAATAQVIQISITNTVIV